ncbi:hypothetical protein [Candidatus Sororendozoicomonas aggregata]|uniref:hypothetical protein n=1 Tax=Candidatus Sororendozoicomonas aggregata TaxID=3073239 RepID=UPI002ED0B25D
MAPPLRRKFMLVGSILVSLLITSGYATNPPQPANKNASANILAQVADAINNDQHLKPAVKKNIDSQLIKPLEHIGNTVVSGDDSDVRPIVVNFQKALEQSLVKLLDTGAITHLTAIIHTPMPTTPLCNCVGKSHADNMHPNLRQDPSRVKTIEDRAVTLRQLATQGPRVHLYVAYPSDGLQKRSAEAQKTYKEEVNNKINTSLIDLPLKCTDMPTHLVGATYFISTPQSQALTVLTLSGVQASEGDGTTNWQLILGDEDNPVVKERLNNMSAYLQQCGYDFKKTENIMTLAPHVPPSNPPK